MHFQPDVTIIIPTHSRDLNDIIAEVKKQVYSGNITIIALDNAPQNRAASMPRDIHYIWNEHNLGLAGSMNKGIRMAKTDFVITLHQDAVPTSSDWLVKLMAPLADPRVVLSSSQQILPKHVWETFSFWHKVFSIPQLTIEKSVNEHATAYRVSTLKKTGLFDKKTFFNGGEDTDLFMRMATYGKLAISDTVIYHVHAPHNDSLWRFMGTFLRCHEAMGVLHRKYLLLMGIQFWYDLFRTVLFLFLVVFLFYNSLLSLLLLGIIVILANLTHLDVFKYISDIRLLLVPAVYTFVWFSTLFVTWNGFIRGKGSLP